MIVHILLLDLSLTSENKIRSIILISGSGVVTYLFCKKLILKSNGKK